MLATYSALPVTEFFASSNISAYKQILSQLVDASEAYYSYTRQMVCENLLYSQK